MKSWRIVFFGLASLALCGAASAQSTLIIRADSACSLIVNGVGKGPLAANTAKPVPVGAGEQLIECQAANGARVEETLSVDGGGQKVVSLKLAAKVGAVAIEKRFTAPGDGTVFDSQTGLQWAQRDNGYHISWSDAHSYCTSPSIAGSGWRLPSMDELEGIYDRSETLTMSCGGPPCHVSPLFSLTTYWYWSSQQNGSSEAWFFDFSDGSRNSGTASEPFNSRALCVRHRS